MACLMTARAERLQTNVARCQVRVRVFLVYAALDTTLNRFLAGGSYHTSLSKALTVEHIQDFADIAGLECLRIDGNTNVQTFSNELKWNDLYYHLAKGV